MSASPPENAPSGTVSPPRRESEDARDVMRNYERSLTEAVLSPLSSASRSPRNVAHSVAMRSINAGEARGASARHMSPRAVHHSPDAFADAPPVALTMFSPRRRALSAQKQTLDAAMSVISDEGFAASERGQVKPMQKLELQDMTKMALQPVPLDAGIIRCYVKQVYRGMFKQYGYELYLQGQIGTQEEDKFLLAARRQVRSNMTCANYTICTDKECTDAKRIGRMGSNFLAHVLHTVRQRARSPETGQDPRRWRFLQDRATHESPRPTRYSSLHGDMKDLMRFSNREPVFREDLGAYCLDFGGRVSMASVKNFQLISSEDPSMGNILQFGRVADDMFTMDFSGRCLRSKPSPFASAVAIPSWPVSSLCAMTVLLPSFIADGNWFLLALAAPVAALGALVHPRWRVHFGDVSRRSTKRLYLLWGLLILCAILGVLGISLEVYHSRGCPNSAVFRYEIENLARFVYQLCTVPTCHTGLRSATYSICSVSNFSEVVRREAYLELQRPVYVVYHTERELVQIYLDEAAKGSHADIWFYREEVDEETGTKWLVNDDRTIRGKWLLYDQVLPLHEEPAFFLNVPVTVPRNASYLARAEYGSNYMTPITMRMECIENMINGYTFYKTSFLTKLRYATTFLAMVAAGTLLAANYIPPLSRALQIKKGGKSGGPSAWLEAAQRGSDRYFV
ncbi:Tubby C-terminal-like domain [Phytophthora cactorum]|nr:Tubby C-terminal-like domain [Phytophthora cactorum]